MRLDARRLAVEGYVALAVDFLSQLGGPAQVLILRPRTVGLRLSTHF